MNPAQIQTSKESFRRRLAYLSALFISFIIFVVYLAAGGLSLYQKTDDAASTKESVASPLEVLGQEMKFAGSQIKDGWELLSEAFKNLF